MIQITSVAIQEIHRLINYQPELPIAKIRLSITPGCCADWAYVFGLDTAVKDGDFQINYDGFTIVINQSDASLLKGVSIDYSEDLMGGAFRYQNPNAASVSDCGNSFDAV